MLICLYFRMYACLSVNIAGAQLPKRHYINIRYKLMAINIDKHRKPVLFSAGTPFLRLFILDSVFLYFSALCMDKKYNCGYAFQTSNVFQNIFSSKKALPKTLKQS